MFNKQAQSMLLQSHHPILLCFLFYVLLFLIICFFCFFFLSLPFLLVMSHTSHLQERSPTSIGLLFAILFKYMSLKSEVWSLKYLCTKARGTSLWPKLQLWHQSVSASMVNPTAFLPLHTSQCTSGDDAHLRHRSQARTGRYVLPASAGFVATSTRCTRSVYSYVTVRGWRLWRRNVLNLSSPTLHVGEIPFLLSHATFPSFPYTCLLDSSRARPAQSENIAIDNPIDSGRMDKDAVTIVRFAFSTQVISFRYILPFPNR